MTKSSITREREDEPGPSTRSMDKSRRDGGRIYCVTFNMNLGKDTFDTFLKDYTKFLIEHKTSMHILFLQETGKRKLDELLDAINDAISSMCGQRPFHTKRAVVAKHAKKRDAAIAWNEHAWKKFFMGISVPDDEPCYYMLSNNNFQYVALEEIDSKMKFLLISYHAEQSRLSIKDKQDNLKKLLTWVRKCVTEKDILALVGGDFNLLENEVEECLDKKGGCEFSYFPDEPKEKKGSPLNCDGFIVIKPDPEKGNRKFWLTVEGPPTRHELTTRENDKHQPIMLTLEIMKGSMAEDRHEAERRIKQLEAENDALKKEKEILEKENKKLKAKIPNKRSDNNDENSAAEAPDTIILDDIEDATNERAENLTSPAVGNSLQDRLQRATSPEQVNPALGFEDFKRTLQEFLDGGHEVVWGFHNNNSCRKSVLLISWMAYSSRTKRVLQDKMVLYRGGNDKKLEAPGFILFFPEKEFNFQPLNRDREPYYNTLNSKFNKTINISKERTNKMDIGNGGYLFQELTGVDIENLCRQTSNEPDPELCIDMYKPVREIDENKRVVVFFHHSQNREGEKNELDRMGLQHVKTLTHPIRRWEGGWETVGKLCSDQQVNHLKNQEEAGHLLSPHDQGNATGQRSRDDGVGNQSLQGNQPKRRKLQEGSEQSRMQSIEDSGQNSGPSIDLMTVPNPGGNSVSDLETEMEQQPNEAIYSFLTNFLANDYRIFHGFEKTKEGTLRRVVFIHWFAMSFAENKYINNVMVLRSVNRDRDNPEFHLFNFLAKESRNLSHSGQDVVLPMNDGSDLTDLPEPDEKYCSQPAVRYPKVYFKTSEEDKNECGNGAYLFKYFFGENEEVEKTIKLDHSKLRPLSIYTSKDKRCVVFVDHSLDKGLQDEEKRRLKNEFELIEHPDSFPKPSKVWHRGSYEWVYRFCERGDLKDPRLSDIIAQLEKEKNDCYRAFEDELKGFRSKWYNKDWERFLEDILSIAMNSPEDKREQAKILLDHVKKKLEAKMDDIASFLQSTKADELRKLNELLASG